MPNMPEREYSPEELTNIYNEQLNFIFSGEPDFVVQKTVLDSEIGKPESMFLALNQIVDSEEIPIFRKVIAQEGLDALSQAYLIANFEDEKYLELMDSLQKHPSFGKEEQIDSFRRTLEALERRAEELAAEKPDSSEANAAKDLIGKFIIDDIESAHASDFEEHWGFWETALFHQTRITPFLSDEQRQKLKVLFLECQKEYEKLFPRPQNEED